MNLFTDCQNLNRKGKYGGERSKSSQENHSLALSLRFVSAKDLVSGGHTRGILVAKPAWVPTCPGAYALSWGERETGDQQRGRGREEPAGWQRNTLGMNCVLVLTLPQAVLPDGRKFERSQL